MSTLTLVPPATPDQPSPRPRPTASPAEQAVAAAAALVDPIGLDELMELAELQTRVDRKYFVPADVFRRLIAELAGELRVLEIDGRRTFGYESVYFDTPDLATYRAHLQRRRQRFKARTRTYTDSGLCMFEVKLTGARGETVKERVPHPSEYRAELTEEALAHLRTTLCQAYHQDLPDRAAAHAGHHLPAHHLRLPHRGGPADLRRRAALPRHAARGPRHRHPRAGGEQVRGQGGSAADRILRELGVRPASVSKYCVGVAALHPELPSNPWHQTLRRYFQPLQAAA